MSRPRSFDPDTVLDAATELFWRHGYAATSMRDIEAATGLCGPSLYNAFGGKQALFRRCLDRYRDANLDAHLAAFEAELPPRGAIEAFFARLLARSCADRRGCLLVNTAVELGPDPAGPSETVAAPLAGLQAFFGRCVAAGQRAGSITRSRDADDLARLLLTTALGLRVLARAGPDAPTLEGAVRAALSLLDPVPTEEPR